MKIQIISDLHQEFGLSDLNFENADLIILAGDIPSRSGDDVSRI